LLAAAVAYNRPTGENAMTSSSLDREFDETCPERRHYIAPFFAALLPVTIVAATVSSLIGLG
jgi:hypothetical protein